MTGRITRYTNSPAWLRRTEDDNAWAWNDRHSERQRQDYLRRWINAHAHQMGWR